MAIFSDTPTISFRAAVAKYPARFLCLIFHPVAALALSAVWPPFEPWFSGTFLFAAAAAAGWPVVFGDAPVNYWAACVLGWFAVELVTTAVAPAAVIYGI